MAIIEIKVPEIGESVTEVTLSAWLKQDGEYIYMDEEIAEFESDKATLEFPSPESGQLIIVADVDSDLEIGDLFCKIDTSVQAPKGAKPTAASPMPKNESPKTEPIVEEKKEAFTPDPNGKREEIVMPEIGESITEATLVEWLVNDGDIVKLDQDIAEVDSDKATLEFPSPFAGKIELVAKPDQDVKIGELVCYIDTAYAALANQKPAAKPAVSVEEIKPTEQKPSDKNYATGHASPAAAKLMREEQVSSTQVSGSGMNGRITKEDVIAYLQSGGIANANEVVTALGQTASREQRREKMSRMRRTISKRLVEVKNETAMLTTFNDVNMEPIMTIRNKYKKAFEEKHGVRLGFMSFFTRACAIALQKWPAVNAYIDGTEVLYNDYADISIAVSTPKGLVVPVMKNTETMSLAAIEAKVRELAIKGRDGQLSMDEMTGGTFTITNGGVFGSLLSTPIINAPQSAILGMHRIEERPVVVNGEIVVKPMMYLALSYDHRIIDGKESVSFLVEVKNQLENPERMLLGEDPVEVLLGL